MFEETLHKFVLVIALFAVFVLFGNIFAASQQAANRRTASFRRRGRRDRRRAATAASDEGGAMEPAGEEDAGLEDVDQRSTLRRMVPQLILSAVALIIAGLALYVMWRVARGG